MILINMFKTVVTFILYLKFIYIFHNHVYNKKIYCLILESLEKNITRKIISSDDKISYLYKCN